MPALSDKYKVQHFDAKARRINFFRDSGVPTHVPVRLVLLGQPHLLRRRTCQRVPTATMYFTLPTGSAMAEGRDRDIGRVAYGNPAERGKVRGAEGGRGGRSTSPVPKWRAALGRARPGHPSQRHDPEAYRALGSRNAKTWATCSILSRLRGPSTLRDVGRSRELNPSLGVVRPVAR